MARIGVRILEEITAVEIKLAEKTSVTELKEYIKTASKELFGSLENALKEGLFKDELKLEPVIERDVLVMKIGDRSVPMKELFSDLRGGDIEGLMTKFDTSISNVAKSNAIRDDLLKNHPAVNLTDREILDASVMEKQPFGTLPDTEEALAKQLTKNPEQAEAIEKEISKASKNGFVKGLTTVIKIVGVVAGVGGIAALTKALIKAQQDDAGVFLITKSNGVTSSVKLTNLSCAYPSAADASSLENYGLGAETIRLMTRVSDSSQEFLKKYKEAKITNIDKQNAFIKSQNNATDVVDACSPESLKSKECICFGTDNEDTVQYRPPFPIPYNGQIVCQAKQPIGVVLGRAIADTVKSGRQVVNEITKGLFPELSKLIPYIRLGALAIVIIVALYFVINFLNKEKNVASSLHSEAIDPFEIKHY